ncbi:hypothetical protein PPL_03725 [Heterostelium album PN500]|uniref:S-adenosyl-L-methionine-dependent methyltransferase n=1 Tax=Heterostelium pallidum (strain ATCC 26659 / Pp 5 / PN500) TaxID=670386 RepID=D3B6H7_HETP5|nr:hypothetical protein PPL_03725 [Heterostelium album PN500]EFA82947.1 hypothetical protein PPL_03725 [Heterostelium album PN500]|eukprot:XP_020435064.1 hypothetical protein PPL_03725 [Heterostelium album PN500]
MNNSDNNQNSSTIVNSNSDIINGVARTSLFVSAGRAYTTNSYVRNILANGSDEEKARIVEFLPYFQERLSDSFIPPKAGIYDPYSFYFSTTSDALELIKKTIAKVDPDYPLADINKYNPMYLWSFISESAHLRVAFRTKYIDHFIESQYNNSNNNDSNDNYNNNQFKQLIILGAGLDTRALRLNIPDDTVVYELDLLEVIEYKKRLLVEATKVFTPKTKCKLVQIPTDLRYPELWTKSLLDAGFQSDRQSLWVLEGLLMYLTESDIKILLDTINQLCSPASKILIHTVNEVPLEKRTLIFKEFNSLTDHPENYLIESGFTKDIKPISYIEINQMFGDDTTKLSKSSMFTSASNVR